MRYTRSMSFRTGLNIATALVIAIMVWFMREDLVQAFHLLGRVNLWILLLIIPLQFLSYYASGEAIFSYLKQRGQMKNLHMLTGMRLALELNFVNHILPTAGVSGASYMTWRLSKLGVSSGRATLAQFVRFVAVFLTFIVLLMLSVVFVTIDTGVNRMLILTSSGLVSVIIVCLMVAWYVMDSDARLKRFSKRVARAINWAGRSVLRLKHEVLTADRVTLFFDELQDDYLALKREPRLLLRPLVWGVIFNVTEISLFFFTFLALGSFINPAAILIAVGVAALVGTFLVTPGGAGGYEAAAVLMLTIAGFKGATVLAGVLLARVILIVLTIVSGYLFYYLALKKYGKHPKTT